MKPGKGLIQFDIPITSDENGGEEFVLNKLKQMNMNQTVIDDEKTGQTLAYLSYENLQFKVLKEAGYIRVTCHCYFTDAGKERLHANEPDSISVSLENSDET